MRSFLRNRAWVIGAGVLAAALAACGGPVREDELLPVADTEDAVRACASGPTVQGIDVSSYQGNIDWGAVARSGKTFAIMKATEGTGWSDPTFHRNWAGARAAGVIRGAYHFFHPALDPIAQANRFVDMMGPLGPGDLPPMLDLEDANRLPPSRVADATRRFLQQVEARTGRRPMIYTGYYFWRDQVGNPGGFSQYPLVMAAYVSGCPLVPDSWGRFTMWQYSSSGRVPGISGNVDLDVFNGDINALRALAGGHVGPPPPPPPPPSGCGILGWNHSLARGQGENSCSGRFTFVHQGDGNVVLYDNADGHRALWSTGTNGRATDHLWMQADGNLVVYAPGGHPLWASGTDGHPGSYLAVQDDGNVVIYAPGGHPLWATNTVRAAPPPPPPPHPAGCGIAGPNKVLHKNEGVRSCDGRFFFVHQGDGNVVLYGPHARALWSTRTDRRATDALIMQGDGNLVLYAPGGHAIWASRTDRHPGAFLAVQDDGNVVVYAPGGHPLWATNTVQ